MQRRITINGLSDIDRAAKEFISLTQGKKLIAFYAPMGAGKTTFTTAVCRNLGVDEAEISSPTFSIVNEYRTESGERIFHFDFYRITRIPEALDIGFYDYMDSCCLCLMEWPENIEDILPEETLKVYIKVLDDESREIIWDQG